VLYSPCVAHVFRFLKSVRLAVVLILLITALSLLSTLVPQDRPAAWYAARYSPWLVTLVAAFRFDRFFSSLLFLAPVCLFSVSLAACAVDRVVVRQRNHAKRRYGPDLIHAGLLVLIAAGLVTATGRAERVLPLAVGEEVVISPGWSLRVLSLRALAYDNGMPREWTSVVSVSHDGASRAGSFSIEVNHPLRAGGVSVYQSSWDTEGLLELTDAQGNTEKAVTGQGFEDGGSTWYFAETHPGTGGGLEAVFQEYRGKTLVSARTLRPGDGIGPFTVRAVSQREVTGLKVVRDPGIGPFLAALLLILSGLCLTFIQKRGDA
jgi:hypothetical protein